MNNSDCAFWTQPCSCPPCGKVWRRVLNRKELAKLVVFQNYRRSPGPSMHDVVPRSLKTQEVVLRPSPRRNEISESNSERILDFIARLRETKSSLLFNRVVCGIIVSGHDV
jgi:hypothetical protein